MSATVADRTHPEPTQPRRSQSADRAFSRDRVASPPPTRRPDVARYVSLRVILAYAARGYRACLRTAGNDPLWARRRPGPARRRYRYPANSPPKVAFAAAHTLKPPRSSSPPGRTLKRNRPLAPRAEPMSRRCPDPRSPNHDHANRPGSAATSSTDVGSGSESQRQDPPRRETGTDRRPRSE